MNSRLLTGIVIAVIGIFLVVVGSMMAMRLLNINLAPPEAQATPQVEPAIQIAFVAGNVAAGKVLTVDNVILKDIPIQYVPQNAIDDLQDAIGKITKVDLYQGEMVLKHHLADPTGQVYDVAYILSDSHVLVALPANDLMSREAIIKRGDIIDILVSSNQVLSRVGETGVEEESDKIPQQITFPVLQRVNITALVIEVVKKDEDSQQTGDAIPKREDIMVQTYLVAMDPQDALIIKYLKDSGAIFDYVLRAPTSSGQFDLTPVTAEFIQELYGLQLLP